MKFLETRRQREWFVFLVIGVPLFAVFNGILLWFIRWEDVAVLYGAVVLISCLISFAMFLGDWVQRGKP